MKGTKTKHQISERSDLVTGNRVRRLTSLPGSHQHLYFTSKSFTRDSQSIICISNQDANPNIYQMSLQDGESRQLTNNRDRYLMSYVYYDGTPFHGLGKASVSYNPETNHVLYIQGNEVRLLDVDSLEEEVISVLPNDVVTGFTHLSSDGRYACIPYIDATAFDVGSGNKMKLIKDKVQSRQLESRVLVIDTEKKISEVLFSHVGWITHVQFSPVHNDEILFNHEGGDVDQRIWLYRHGAAVKIRDESIERGTVWICHEVWAANGSSIVYHGTKCMTGKFDERSISFVGSFNLEKNNFVEVPFLPNMNHYGHFSISQDSGTLVTDGVITANMLHHCVVDWNDQSLSWTPLCLHDSSFCVQDVHPHPVFSHDGHHVLFTSDVDSVPGMGNIYIVDIE
ncbi:oligogalacturonate lyase family protein [Alicyclobacillus fastidiosus]|uniref:Oligogalacturonate lyase family protein n=1 Tax=Alicyclobacillus fastidiosus TaxID=392011 RepID=A0ABY6ZBE3_9BACL|nr:oligogalacturonate lyase family protein [Alicyclobacillus fastidiosus]WAH39862.1 oligogalacturonate lyase family protein [Alicyclobacillus fastidiosus]GMA61127.1 oligogalacturonate lyase [Alicyclobacillus fastidiosus]